MRGGLMASASAFALALALAGPAQAGNIVLTGHDNDLHYDGFAGATQPKNALAAELKFVRNGSTLPVLTFDAGTQLTASLTALGISFTNINPSSAISASVFDNTKYSAFAVASVTSCGGCDNSAADISNITADSSAIATFFNNGGGILGLAGASDSAAYAYVPKAATNAGGSPPSTGYVQTAEGALLGLPAVNGDPTHNFFNEPGTGGLSASYVVTERNGSALTGTPETIALAGGKIVGTTIVTGGGSVPEPGTLALFGTGLVGLALRRRRKKPK